MTMTTRRLHRWLGLLVGLPCLLWGVSGALLSYKHLAMPVPPGDPAAVSGPRTPFAASVDDALRAAGRADTPLAVEFRWLLGRPRYALRYAAPPTLVLLDGRHGRPLPPADEALARRVAQADAPRGARVVRVALQERHTLVYRPGGDRELPAYRVTLSNGHDVYISQRSGEVLVHADTLYRLLRIGFFAVHMWDLSLAPGRHLSFALLLGMALLLCLSGASGLLLWLRPSRRRLDTATARAPE